MYESLESALVRFNVAMLEKFLARDAKQGERSVVRVGDSKIREAGIFDGMLSHLFEEVSELADEPHSDREQVDVANIAFLLWWHDNPQAPAGEEVAGG